MARPTVMTKEVLQKLEEAFALGASDEEACYYADISQATLYNYQAKHPRFLEQKQRLRQRPILKARMVVVRGLESNPELAFKFLERKRKEEFGPKYEIKAETTEVTRLDPTSSETRAIVEKYEEELRQSIVRGVRQHV